MIKKTVKNSRGTVVMMVTRTLKTVEEKTKGESPSVNNRFYLASPHFVFHHKKAYRHIYKSRISIGRARSSHERNKKFQ